MVKTDLTDEEKKLIIEALNSNTEPPPKLTKRGRYFEPGVSNRCYYGVLIEQQKDDLIDTIEKNLKQKVTIKNLFTIQRKLV